MEQKVLKKIQQLTELLEIDTKERAALIEKLQQLDNDINNNCIAIRVLKELIEPEGR